MLVRASKHVDLSGKVYHPYLAYWHMNTEESTLLQFVRVLQEVFAVEPPVYTKPTNAPVSVPPPQNNAYHNSGYPGQPQQSSQTAGAAKAYQEPSRLQQPQPQASPQQQQQQHHSRGNQPPLQHPQPGYATQPPQYQPSPPQQHLSMPDPRRHTTPSPSSMLTQQAPPIPPPPPNYLRGSSNSPHPNSQPYQSHSPQPQRASLHQPPAPPQHHPQQQQQQQQQQHKQPVGTSMAAPPVPHKPLAASIDTQAYQTAVDERTAKLNAIRDALRARLRDKEAELNATLPPEIERLLNMNRGLEDSGARIAKAIKDATAHESEIKVAIEAVQQKTAEVVEQTSTIQAQPDVNIDTLLDGPSVVHNQLIDLVGQDHAIDDTLYYLGKALDAERIDGAVYMKV
ncbi:hypothetical protein HDU86_003969 [Geranomyces michiganensis]|nr:hypothetical protein HDU86_003969 [Geranomyces michiganensis]